MEYVRIGTIDQFMDFLLSTDNNISYTSVIRYIAEKKMYDGKTYLRQSKIINNKLSLDDLDFFIKGGELIIGDKHYILADIGYSIISFILLKAECWK